MCGGGWSAGAEVQVVWRSNFSFFAFPYCGGFGFEFYMFAIGWRHAFRSEWPYAIFVLYAVVTRSLSVTHYCAVRRSHTLLYVRVLSLGGKLPEGVTE